MSGLKTFTSLLPVQKTLFKSLDLIYSKELWQITPQLCQKIKLITVFKDTFGIK